MTDTPPPRWDEAAAELPRRPQPPGGLRLFRLEAEGAVELAADEAARERPLQRLCEGNLAALLGMTFLASEHATGPVHGGRIDTLAIDDGRRPTILEYKRSVFQNVVGQALYYLDWLLDHRREFEWLVLEKLGPEAAQEVEWAKPRVVCLAGDFGRYDVAAARRLPVELVRYRLFGADQIALDWVHAPKEGRDFAPVARPPSEAEAADGETLPVRHVALDALARVLTPRRADLLRRLRAHEMRSIRALAKALGRNCTNVHGDVQALAAIGLVDVSRYRGVRADYDLIQARLTL